ncbi:MAG TPA: hypothetical protein VGJ70_24055 [Solirubrobacteraceae bacterium]
MPAAISMATSDHASRARPEQTLMQPLRSTIATPHRRGHHCHRFGGAGQGTDSTSTRDAGRLSSER